MLVADGAVRADDEGFGHAVDAPIDGGAALRVDAYGRVGVAERAEEAAGVVRVVALVDADDADGRVLGEFDEKRMLLPARPAPGRPDIHDGDAALEVLVRESRDRTGRSAVRPSSGARLKTGAGLLMRAEGTCAGSPPPRRNTKSSASPTKIATGSRNSSRLGDLRSTPLAFMIVTARRASGRRRAIRGLRAPAAEAEIDDRANDQPCDDQQGHPIGTGDENTVGHASRRLCVEALGLEDGQGAHPAAQDFGAHAGRGAGRCPER